MTDSADNIGNTREPAAVRSMFNRIARRYDVANHLLSGGIDFWWRHRAAEMIKAWQPGRVLDLACGTGDLALAIDRKLPGAEITAVDFSSEMLALARRKGVRRTLLADALHLPFAERSFDCVTVAFGLRNMVDWGAALREIARVLTANGHLLVLDFSMPRGLLRSGYHLRRLLPRLAGAITGRTGIRIPWLVDPKLPFRQGDDAIDRRQRLRYCGRIPRYWRHRDHLYGPKTQPGIASRS